MGNNLNQSLQFLGVPAFFCRDFSADLVQPGNRFIKKGSPILCREVVRSCKGGIASKGRSGRIRRWNTFRVFSSAFSLGLIWSNRECASIITKP